VVYGPVERRRYERRAVIELADIPGGYGWVFPKADHANVGVGAWQSAGPQLRDHLARLCAAHGLEPDALSELRGHRLPLPRPGKPRRAARFRQGAAPRARPLGALSPRGLMRIR